MSIINEIILEDGQENPASIFVDENGKLKFKDRDDVSVFLSTLASGVGVSKLIDAAHGEPSDTLPPEVVVYIDLDDMQLYKRTESGWGVGLTLRGLQGEKGDHGREVRRGETNPNDASMQYVLQDAIIGDVYIEAGLIEGSKHQIWTKSNNLSNGLQWEKIGRPFGGSQGQRGKSIFEGNEDPTHPSMTDELLNTVSGDLYINVVSHQIWKKVDGIWITRGASYAAPIRNSIYQGTSNPNSAIMEMQLSQTIIGDIYLETDTFTIWKKIRNTISQSGPKWEPQGQSFRGQNGTHGNRGSTVFQGVGDPNTFSSNPENAPAGFSGALDGDIFIDTSIHIIWKLVDGTWTTISDSYKGSPGIKGAGHIYGSGNPQLIAQKTKQQWITYTQNPVNQIDIEILEAEEDWDAVHAAVNGDKYTDAEDGSTYTKISGSWITRKKNLLKNTPLKSGEGKLRFKSPNGTYIDLDGTAIGLGSFNGKTPNDIKNLVDAAHIASKAGVDSIDQLKNSNISISKNLNTITLNNGISTHVAVISKSDIGLSFVENKSSNAIRSEITIDEQNGRLLGIGTQNIVVNNDRVDGAHIASKVGVSDVSKIKNSSQFTSLCLETNINTSNGDWPVLITNGGPDAYGMKFTEVLNDDGNIVTRITNLNNIGTIFKFKESGRYKISLQAAVRVTSSNSSNFIARIYIGVQKKKNNVWSASNFSVQTITSPGSTSTVHEVFNIDKIYNINANDEYRFTYRRDDEPNGANWGSGEAFLNAVSSNSENDEDTTIYIQKLS